MKTYAEKFIADVALTELDMDWPFYDGDTRNEVLIPKSSLGFAESPSIHINRLIELLESMKEAGADRVYIHDHCDHHGYYFYGVKLVEL